MSVRVHRSERSRHLVLRVSAGELLPDALVARLSEERVACGWIRASGVLTDVELRAFDATAGGLGRPRLIAGPVQVLALEGSVGLVAGVPGVSLRALLAREGDRGLETLAGEISIARSVALEVLVTVLEDLSLERALDELAGVWLLDSRAPAAAAPEVRGWSTAVEASSSPERGPTMLSRSATAAAASPKGAAAHEVQAASPKGAAAHEVQAAGPKGAVHEVQAAQFATVQIPQRPARPTMDHDTMALVPEAGDVVDHFAFGRSDVVRSENDRLHLRVHKDGRIREIALEMLRVTRLEDDGGPRRFKLERRI
jgi:predicted DNA-binding protein with PD1-like motif